MEPGRRGRADRHIVDVRGDGVVSGRPGARHGACRWHTRWQAGGGRRFGQHEQGGQLVRAVEIGRLRVGNVAMRVGGGEQRAQVAYEIVAHVGKTRAREQDVVDGLRVKCATRPVAQITHALRAVVELWQLATLGAGAAALDLHRTRALLDILLVDARGQVASAAIGPGGGGQQPLINVEARKGAQQYLGPRLPVREAAAREYCLGLAALLGRHGFKAEAHGAVVRRLHGRGSEFSPEAEQQLVNARALVPRP